MLIWGLGARRKRRTSLGILRYRKQVLLRVQEHCEPCMSLVIEE